MNQLEAEKLKEEAKKYVGRTISYKKKNSANNKWEDISYRYTGENLEIQDSENVADGNLQVIQKGTIRVQIWAKLVEVGNESNYATPTLKSVIEQIKRQE